MAKTVTLRIDDQTYQVFSDRAKAEKRSLSNYIEIAALEHSRESDFADDLEMEEVLANSQLQERMKEGSKQAKERKGRLVG